MMKRVIFVFVLFLSISIDGWAVHIFGGDFRMIAQPTQGNYLLTLTLYSDMLTLNPVVGGDFSNNDASATVYIFRKSDHVRMDAFELPQQVNQNKPIIYQNEACAGNQQLRTVAQIYSRAISLSPARYNDSQGYYIIWERCCRTAGVDNLQNRGQNVGLVFTLEFPALTQNGTFFRNSSPDLSIPNGEYICINRPFRMNMSATDADGDELRYTLVTPLNGYTNETNPRGLGESRSSYPEVRWAAGYGLSNTIPGNPALAIHPTTGFLTVRASQLGRFTFAILVEEYRNGVKIGSTRREFQLKVIDCGGTPPPSPTVFNSTNTSLPASVVEICEGTNATLQFTSQPNVSYQWQKDGINIPNQKSTTVTINQAGEYQVTASYTSRCALDTVSQLVKVVIVKGPTINFSPSDTLRICNGDTAIIQTTQGNGFVYEWRRDGAVLPTETRSSLATTQIGTYQVAVRGTNACISRDTAVVILRPSPAKPDITSAKTQLCGRDSIKLQTVLAPGLSVEWRFNGQVLPQRSNEFNTKLAGTYQVRVSSGSCSALSDPKRITQVLADTIRFDSLLAVCYDPALRVALQGSPANGIFVGNGVETNNLNVQTAGVGRHSIQYQVNFGNDCVLSKTRVLEIKPIPVLKAPNSVTQLKDASVNVQVQSETPNGETYQWTPPTGIENPTALQTNISTPDNETYTLTATASNGCSAQISIKVVVVHLMFIPDAFSPNGDGTNDTWEIKNLEKFPDAEVFVYNRWGELIHHQSKDHPLPWDGFYENSPAPIGEYTYLILPNTESDNVARRGKVLLLR
ncbi:gliding motility-associated C-terminal domain-containing protein [Runella sp. SP2]|uniref:T9SS type B sorting domain-containing protein n=1 Tax=Runella sp. SP2 TaxID=2268026 RepID=UPI000F099BD0|nr:gliding motility-associated C-terminal domain-containing protein [Runella sp. SP2]AYQ33008.1 hypothetical protein DTQ70_12965 [Runella sp. SP2]